MHHDAGPRRADRSRGRGFGSDKECVQQRPPKTCTVTVGAMVDCFKAAKADACAAFGGACSVLFEQGNGCT